eukprot:COSAG02_NODE_4913_length_4840_cov_2.322717_8_plen_54_part_00
MRPRPRERRRGVGARTTTRVVGSLVGWSVQKQEAGQHGEEIRLDEEGDRERPR